MSNGTTMKTLKEREMIVFSTIPGMNELLQAKPSEKDRVHAQYPDAVFAVYIATSLFNHNRELSEITQKAYFSILNGENIASVRFAYRISCNLCLSALSSICRQRQHPQLHAQPDCKGVY